MEYILVAVAYLSGSIPFALILVRFSTGSDVRRQGSGNVGATNAVRAAGWGVGALVALLDIAKGALPVLLMSVYDPAGRWVGAAAVAAVLGHCFPVWLRFRGGKGVATGLGSFLPIAPLSLGVALIVWLVVVMIRRTVSLASMVSAALFPVIVFFVSGAGRAIVTSSVIIAVVIIIRHIPNIKRLLSGEEPSIDESLPRSGKGGQG